jgi:Tfp pilus assembly protein PilF
VFEKGDNREPSTARYDSANAHVIRAIAIMERELAREPTPDGLAHLARTYHLARRSGEALAVVQRGLERWPDHVRLLMVGARAAHRLRDDTLEQHFQERLGRATGADPEAG